MFSSGPVQALDYAGANRIANAGEDDGYGCGCGLRRLGSLRSETRDDHVRLGFDEFGGQLRQALQLSISRSEVENQILSFGVAQLIKPLFYDQRVLIAQEDEVSHTVGLRRLLRARSERPSSRRAGDWP